MDTIRNNNLQRTRRPRRCCSGGEARAGGAGRAPGGAALRPRQSANRMRAVVTSRPVAFPRNSRATRVSYEAQNLKDLKLRIINAFDEVKSDISVLNKLNDNLFKRARLYLEKGGHHFEQLLKYSD